MIKKLLTVVYCFTIFSITLQTGKHFWPAFTILSGQYIDYLSPTVYISDICVGIVITLSGVILYKEKKLKNIFKSPLLYILLITLGVSVLYALNLVAAVYGTIKLLEMFAFGYVTARVIDWKTIRLYLIDVFALGGLLVSILALWQFFIQHSVGGLWYFLGERSFSLSTLHIAKAVLNNHEWLRSYATFPHPNLLAFYLVVAIVLMVYGLSLEVKKHEKNFLLVCTTLSSIALFFTLSRVVTACFIGIVLMYVVSIRRMQKTTIVLYVIVIVLISALLVLYTRVIQNPFIYQDIQLRLLSVQIALQSIREHWVSGIGLKNFFYYELLFAKSLNMLSFQPVHNIYLLTFVELGILGFLLGIYGIILTFIRLIKFSILQKSNRMIITRGLLGVFIMMVVVGMFDHYLVTLQQGQILTAFIIGLIWNNSIISMESSAGRLDVDTLHSNDHR